MEYKIVYFLNHLGSGTVIDNFSFYLSWIPFLVIFWLILALAALIFDKNNGKRIFWGTIMVLIIYFVINDLFFKQALANVFFRERPYIAFPDTIISRGQIFVDSSFPSGHMAIMAALSTFYVYFYHRWWTFVLAGLSIILIAFSRLHNGMHYPTDILTGTILGVGYGLLAVFLTKKISI